MRPSRALAFALTLALALTFAREGAAELDPSKASGQAEAARGEPAMEFCRKPRAPLGERALELCTIAEETPGCDGFRAACAAALAKKPDEAPSEAWARIVRALGVVAHVLVYVLVAGAVALLLVPIVRALRKRKRDRSVDEELPAVASPEPRPEAPLDPTTIDDAEAALTRADTLAREGDLRRATSLYLLASLSALDRRGAIHVTKSRTNGEYVRACAEESSRASLRAITREADRQAFGAEAPAGSEVDRIAKLARAIVRAVPLGLLLLTSLFGAGCSPRPRTFDDPAGNELFFEVMKRQGSPVAPLGSSIAKLSPVTDDTPSPILLVDLERTALEPEAEAALTAFAESGGVLVLFGQENHKLSETFGFQTSLGIDRAIDVSLTPLSVDVDDDDDEEPAALDARLARAYAEGTRHFTGKVARPRTVRMAGARALGTLHGEPYVAAKTYGKGTVVVVGTDDLLSNVVLARPENAAAIVAVLAELSASPALPGEPNERRSALARPIRIARPEDGASPPSNPFSALARAGLGRGMWHALVASLVLFMAYGIRRARPRPEPAPSRRAFTEHVEAVGAFYARAPRPTHALAAFSRYCEEKLRSALPRGSHDVPAFLAARTGRTVASCREVWERALAARSEDSPKGDELRVLRDLRALVVAAIAHDDPETRKMRPS